MLIVSVSLPVEQVVVESSGWWGPAAEQLAAPSGSGSHVGDAGALAGDGPTTFIPHGREAHNTPRAGGEQEGSEAAAGDTGELPSGGQVRVERLLGSQHGRLPLP